MSDLLEEFDEPSNVDYNEFTKSSYNPPIQEGVLVRSHKPLIEMPEPPQHTPKLPTRMPEPSSNVLNFEKMFQFQERGIKNIPQATVVLTAMFKRPGLKTEKMIQKMKQWDDLDYTFLFNLLNTPRRLFDDQSFIEDIEKLDQWHRSPKYKYYKLTERLKRLGGKKKKNTQKGRRKSKTKRRFMLSKSMRR